MKKTFELIKKFILLGIFFVTLLLVASFTYANQAPILNGGGGGGSGYTSAPTAYISANVPLINYGSSANIHWSSSNATSCSIVVGGSTSGATSGTLSTGAISDDTSYLVTCENPVGIASASVKVVVVPVVVSFYPTASKVNKGGSTTLNWTVLGAKSCTVSGGSLGSSGISVSAHYSHVISNITQKTTYNLSCSTSSTSSTSSSGSSSGSTGQCVGTIAGGDGTNAEGTSCSVFTTRSECLNGWATHGCSWASS